MLRTVRGCVVNAKEIRKSNGNGMTMTSFREHGGAHEC